MPSPKGFKYTWETHAMMIGDWVLASETAFQIHSQVSLLESAPEKCIFTNHGPSVHLKVNLIMWTEFCYQNVKASYHRLTLQLLHRSLRRCESDCETDCTIFLFLDTQDIERGQFLMRRKLLPKLLVVFLPRNLFVWWRLKFFNFDRNHANTPHITKISSSHILPYQIWQRVAGWSSYCSFPGAQNRRKFIGN